MSCSPALQKKQMEQGSYKKLTHPQEREQSLDWEEKKLEEDGNLSLTPTLGSGFMCVCLCPTTTVPILEAKKIKPRKGSHSHTLVKAEP